MCTQELNTYIAKYTFSNNSKFLTDNSLKLLSFQYKKVNNISIANENQVYSTDQNYYLLLFLLTSIHLSSANKHLYIYISLYVHIFLVPRIVATALST